MYSLSKTFGLFFVLLAIFLFCRPAEAQYGGGTGEPNDPYLIYTAEQMNTIGADANDWDKHFILMADIDLSSFTGTSFNIIGYYNYPDVKPFTGVFDGNGRTISNFSYTSTNRDYVGLFGYVRGVIKDLGLIAPDIGAGTGRNIGSLVASNSGTITNCYVEGGSVSAGNNIGGLVGYNSGTITNCYSTGSVTGNERVGGLVGRNGGGTITNCLSAGSVSGTGYDIGGLAGDNHGTITNCSSTGSVSGENSVGGLVGYNAGGFGYYAIITNCYAAGTVSGQSRVGGLVGDNDGTITNSYATGRVSGNNRVGGLVGSNGYASEAWPSPGTISNCYSTGSVSGNSEVGGLVGYNELGEITYSFWDIQTSGQLTSADGTGKTTAQMQMASTFIGWAGCGNEGIWTIDEGNDYPRLWWENKPGEALYIQQLSDFVIGSGTEDDPYLIYTAEELNVIGVFPCDWDKNFKLMADIDLTGFTGTDFNIIGYYGWPFTGVFDGSGHIISNFTYTSTDTDYIGLFGYVYGENAQIKDLGLIAPDIDAGAESYDVGSLVGYNSYGRISNCYAAGGSVSGNAAVGGLVGYNSDTITNCYAKGGSVSGSGWGVGGLVGRNYKGTITNSYSAASVSGTGWGVGGLVGENPWSGTISNCYSSGSVRGTTDVGGLVGSNGSMFGIGGMISNCYSTGRVSGTTDVGGLVGWNYEGSVSNSFWDIQTSGQASSDGGTGKTTAEMQTESTFTDAGWDFVAESVNGTEDIWWILEGQDYPRLWWELIEEQ